MGVVHNAVTNPKELGKTMVDGVVAAASSKLIPAPTSPKPSYVFRGDSRAPAQIFEEGFTAKGSNMNLAEHAKTNPSNSGYIPTSQSPNVARQFADEGGYVYTVQNPQGGINVNNALGTSSPFPAELEIAVPHAIPSSNIVGARQVGSDGKFVGPFIKNPNQ